MILTIVLILAVAFLLSVFCMGIYTITDEGKILHFVKKPFLRILDELDSLESQEQDISSQLSSKCFFMQELKKVEGESFDVRNYYYEIETLKIDLAECRTRMRYLMFFNYISKPLIMCPPCMASYWGVVLYFGIKPLSIDLMFLSIIVASFFNYLLSSIYHRN